MSSLWSMWGVLHDFLHARSPDTKFCLALKNGLKQNRSQQRNVWARNWYHFSTQRKYRNVNHVVAEICAPTIFLKMSGKSRLLSQGKNSKWSREL
jgi:hypothetical protein